MPPKPDDGFSGRRTLHSPSSLLVLPRPPDDSALRGIPGSHRRGCVYFACAEGRAGEKGGGAG